MNFGIGLVAYEMTGSEINALLKKYIQLRVFLQGCYR
jgi:hypothetical protein